MGADRVALHRQRDAAGAEPAAGGAVGQAAGDSEAAALCRHPDLRDGGRLWHAPECVRPGADAGHRVVGVLMRRFDFPAAPTIVGAILGPLAEAQLRNAISIGEGKWSVFIQRPMSATLLAVVVAVLVLPKAVAWIKRARA